ncbi:MAG TPA: hypothetical protein P5279_17835 [Anaerohalosphaeraceae bacterium]|nr:hypothetical protein [Anaerohalosphaeraceae bacterium]HRT52354.1 hypothetical protein [Anaerohalosphaeraceae bacterium]HRT88370.1 hypothetical protein [Anaerohalosphaeraceae bacterium]
MSRKKLVIIVLLLGLFVVLPIVYMIAAAFAVSPPRVRQEILLKTVRKYIVERQNEPEIDRVNCLLEIPLFEGMVERGDLRAIADKADLPKGADLVVFNPGYSDEEDDWVAVYMGSDFESRIRGCLVLNGRGRIIRMRSGKLFINKADLKYYAHVHKRP